MDEAGHSGDDPLSPSDAYARQHSAHRHDRRQAEAERVHPSQHHHLQNSRNLAIPSQLPASLPVWTREAQETLISLLERGDQAAAISEALSGVGLPAALVNAGRPRTSPQGVQQQANHQLHPATALQQQLQQHHQFQQNLQRRNDIQTSNVLSSESYVPPGTDTHALIHQYQLHAQQLAAPPRPRWKPSPNQVSLLEQHFNAGHSKPTQELTSAVQTAGAASEQQVVVWLKNRLARAKRDAKDSKESPSAQQHSLHRSHSSGRAESGRKRSRSSEEDGEVNSEAEDQPLPPQDFHGIVNSALREAQGILEETSADAVATVRGLVRKAGQVCCHGPGREGLVLKAFATRLHHLGIKSCAVGDSCCAAVGNGDLVLISAGPSFYASVSAVAAEARRAGAKVVAFTAHRTAPLNFADHIVRLPARTTATSANMRSFAGSRSGAAQALLHSSVMPMGTAYELALQMLLDTLALMLQRENNVPEDYMKSRTSNLE